MSHVHPFALMSFAGLDTAESRAVGLVGFAVAALPTDPIGTATLTIAASEVDLSGAEIRVYDLDEIAANNFGTELAGVESNSSPTFNYTYQYGVVQNLVWIQIMAPGYVEYGQSFTLPTINTTLSVILQAELNN